jgi:HD domain
MVNLALRHVGAGSPALHRLRLGATLVATRGAGVEEGLPSHCLSTAQMAERLGLGDEVCDPLQQVFTRWDGKGVPSGVAGDSIALMIRLFHLADTVERRLALSRVESVVGLNDVRAGSPRWGPPDGHRAVERSSSTRRARSEPSRKGRWRPYVASGTPLKGTHSP